MPGQCGLAERPSYWTIRTSSVTRRPYASTSLFDLLVKAEDRIWALLLEPAVEKRLLLADGSENRLQDGFWVFLNRRSYYFALVVVDGYRRADR